MRGWWEEDRVQGHGPRGHSPAVQGQGRSQVSHDYVDNSQDRRMRGWWEGSRSRTTRSRPSSMTASRSSSATSLDSQTFQLVAVPWKWSTCLTHCTGWYNHICTLTRGFCSFAYYVHVKSYLTIDVPKTTFHKKHLHVSRNRITPSCAVVHPYDCDHDWTITVFAVCGENISHILHVSIPARLDHKVIMHLSHLFDCFPV